MAHLWIADGGEPAWAALELDAPAYDLTSWPPVRIRAAEASPSDDAAPAAAMSAVTLRTWDEAGRAQWAILAAEGARVAVNGLPVLAGVRVLHEQDELRVGPHCAYFSAERLAQVEDFTGSDRPLSCPRCSKPITANSSSPTQVVRCPGCGVLHHEIPGLRCWTHGATCCLCPQPTSFETGYRWTPEVL